MTTTTVERPSIVEVLRKLPDRKPPSEIEQKVSEVVETQRLQRDQRYAMAMNIVTQARKHGGRDSEIATAADAATVNMIFSLLQGVAKEENGPPDAIFNHMSETTLDSILELVVYRCVNQSAKSVTEESRQSNDNPA